ncbi:MAG: ABC transporter ATP-binding protein [Alphaproteobacteria bacterium]|nr:ABC transporter ATP-binding protein [Alphaproteobacteria bacterium]
MTPPLYRIRGLRVAFPDRSRKPLFGAAPMVEALKGVDLDIARGAALGLVGESGSGKTTIGRAMLRLIRPTAGELVYDGVDIADWDEDRLHPLRARLQMIFQDPQSSLNPRHTIGAILRGALTLHGLDASEPVLASILDRVGLPSSALKRYPHQLSGGQRQRVGIARAIALKPDFVVADEIVSGLDVSTQAQVIDLLKGLREEMGLALAFISHDLSVIRHICSRIVIMKAGEIVEEGDTAETFRSPKTGFTKTLITAIPLPDPDPAWLES